MSKGKTDKEIRKRKLEREEEETDKKVKPEPKNEHQIAREERVCGLLNILYQDLIIYIMQGTRLAEYEYMNHSPPKCYVIFPYL